MEQLLDEEGLHTFPDDTEAIINSSLMTKASSDLNDLEALMSNHLEGTVLAQWLRSWTTDQK